MIGGIDMKKIVNKILGTMLIATMVLSTMSINVNAATGYRQSTMVSACSCGQKNISYGVMRDFRGTSQTLHEGEYCAGCENKVPVGKVHYYYMTEDRFSFTCSKCGRDYYRYSEPNLIEHTVTNE